MVARVWKGWKFSRWESASPEAKGGWLPPVVAWRAHVDDYHSSRNVVNAGCTFCHYCYYATFHTVSRPSNWPCAPVSRWSGLDRRGDRFLWKPGASYTIIYQLVTLVNWQVASTSLWFLLYNFRYLEIFQINLLNVAYFIVKLVTVMSGYFLILTACNFVIL